MKKLLVSKNKISKKINMQKININNYWIWIDKY